MERLTIRNSDGTVSQPMKTALEEVFCRLAYYEDMEEQGRLVVLPCKVGDTIWRIKCNGAWPDFGTPYVEADAFLYRDIHYFGKTVFLTREEAEAALRGGNDDG